MWYVMFTNIKAPTKPSAYLSEKPQEISSIACGELCIQPKKTLVSSYIQRTGLLTQSEFLGLPQKKPQISKPQAQYQSDPDLSKAIGHFTVLKLL